MLAFSLLGLVVGSVQEVFFVSVAWDCGEQVALGSSDPRGLIVMSGDILLLGFGRTRLDGCIPGVLRLPLLTSLAKGLLDAWFVLLEGNSQLTGCVYV